VLAGEFQLPITFDLTATFLFAVTGALAGMRRHYDIIGVFALAFATALGWWMHSVWAFTPWWAQKNR
jgi:hypothetical protein